jgi:regulator of replication initiation timing
MDTEASFLKKKLIETHNKLLKELELNKELDNKLALLTGKCEHLKLENESLQRKLGQATLHEKSRDREDRQVLI